MDGHYHTTHLFLDMLKVGEEEEVKVGEEEVERGEEEVERGEEEVERGEGKSDT
ncbi:hypothetical protein HYZ98_01360 [Candidatus Peregrinibacteria bacterium]|nr:hypothetical protein [Candidatus Peregrinibacteria bacterium]